MIGEKIVEVIAGVGGVSRMSPEEGLRTTNFAGVVRVSGPSDGSSSNSGGDGGSGGGGAESAIVAGLRSGQGDTRWSTEGLSGVYSRRKARDD